MRVSAFSVRSNANGRMRVSASVSKTVRSIDTKPSFFNRVKGKLLSKGIRGRLVDRRASECATTAAINTFFMHFAGTAGEMRLVDLESTSWRDLQPG
jgi:hypothetical protein